MYEARIERDSVTEYGERLTTFVVTMPRIVLAELNTHRVLPKSSASSRAIPVEKQIARLRQDPFSPVSWGKNQKGMQAEEELSPEAKASAEIVWEKAREQAIASAEQLRDLGVHKQITNRLLEPFMWHTVIISGTEWSNFFHLRDNRMAQPELQKAAAMMNELYRASRPLLLQRGEWHLPFTGPEDFAVGPFETDPMRLVKISVGRCARVSYLTHDGKRDPEADVALADSLLKNGHMAPWEHAARPMGKEERMLFGRTRWFSSPTQAWEAGEQEYFCGPFNGWVQARKLIYGERDILAFERSAS